MPRVKVSSAASDRKSIDVEIARLRDLDLKQLRRRWRTIFRRQPLSALPRHLVFAMVAYRLQAEIFGDMDAETLRLLKQIDVATSKTAITSLTKILAQRQREVSPGTILVREWNGQTHRVMVIEHGFAWQGTTYDSYRKSPKQLPAPSGMGRGFLACAIKAPPRRRCHDYGRQCHTLRHLHAGIDGLRS
jgi:Protein of unknown function (DUF2924)